MWDALFLPQPQSVDIFFFHTVGAQVFKTKVIKETVNPKWNQYFEVSAENLQVDNFG